jgi:quercetin dioxygenase-like cupin family protein
LSLENHLPGAKGTSQRSYGATKGFRATNVVVVSTARRLTGKNQLKVVGLGHHFKVLDSAGLQPRVGSVLPLKEVREAHEMLAGAPHQRGKIVLRSDVRWGGLIMTIAKLSFVLVCLITGTLMAQEGRVTQLLSKDLTDLPNKEGLMITVEYPPGGSDPIHRHNAHVFVYVLEGSVVMQVKGGKEITLTPGQSFYEGPDDVHVISRNASNVKPTKFVVFIVKDKGAPIVVPAK